LDIGVAAARAADDLAEEEEMVAKIATSVLVMGLSGLAGSLQAAEFVEVIRGDALVGQLDGGRVVLELAGVWVPSPAGLRTSPQYRGDEARQYVVELLGREEVFVEALHPLRPGTVVPVRIVVGEENGQDLAVLLADAGLALCEPSSAVDPDQAQAICSAEKAARRGHRGIHDGGFQRFEWSQSQMVDLGEFHPQPRIPLTRASGRSYYPGAPLGGQSTARGEWWVLDPKPITHRTPIDAIRDWGAAMGLPRDASSWGH
jgi:endonuclease YncB( thermonuclease family)